MRFGAILALIQGWSNQGLKYALLSTFSELSFESAFEYPFERKAWTPMFMLFWIYFGPHSSFVKPGFEICTFINFLGIEILKLI